MRWLLLTAVAVLGISDLPAAIAAELTTAEQSGYVRTGRYEEVERLCTQFAKNWPKQVRCFEFGRTPEGRPMLALAASADGTLQAEQARARSRPVVLMQGGIHAGEIDGKDAGFLALRELLEGREGKGVLERVTFVFVPVFNVDGHERFGRWHRPNQTGPEESGWRTTAQNLNLNRDYVKAEAPEMHAMLRLLNEWQPIVYADLHATNGAEFQHDISFNIAPTQAGDEQLRRVAVQFRNELMARARAAGSLPIDFYPSFVRDDDPTSGVNANVAPPRFSQQYWALRNRIGVLVETHSWKDYSTRVRITRNAIHDMLALTAANGTAWQSAVRAAEDRARTIGGQSHALVYTNTDAVKLIDFLGYEYTREPSAISGTLLTRYNNKRPQTWRIPLREEVAPVASVVAPRAGYIVPAAHAQWVGYKLQLHGIEFERMRASRRTVQTYRPSSTELATATFEGLTPITLKGAEWRNEEREVPEGSLFVPIGQPHSLLLLALLEPGSPDSLVSWGLFNAAFERKEYMEAYVAESVARDMLSKDAALREEFNQRLANDPQFAKDPAARLEFFYRRHPSWDERFNLYPIYRVDVL